MNLAEFRKNVLKADVKKGKFKITNSNGTKEAWRWLKKNKWLDLGQSITENQFGRIVKAINMSLQDKLLEGKDVILPYRMGKLEVRKRYTSLKYVGDKLKVAKPVDWKRTLELWWEDKESKDLKRLVRFEDLETFIIHYNKSSANYNNKRFYKFVPTRTVRRRLKNIINNSGFDALLLFKKNGVC